MSQPLLPTQDKEYSDADLITELALGSARGGANRQKLAVTVVRSLGAEDLPLLQNPTPVGASVPEIKEIKYAHHRLAQLMAAGRPAAEIQLITGYSLAYQSNIKRSPAFKELLEYYSDETKKVFVDVMERLKDFGVSTLEELKRRMDEKPEGFSVQQLADLARLGLLEPLQTAAKLEQAKGAGAGAMAVAVNVNFVGPGATAEVQGQGQGQAQGQGQVIEGNSQEVEDV